MKRKATKLLSFLMASIFMCSSVLPVQAAFEISTDASNNSEEYVEYQTSGDEDFPLDTVVYAVIGSTYKVTIPKVIILSGTTKEAHYYVKVTGDIAGNETIRIIPDESVELNSANKLAQMATVTQDRLAWRVEDLGIDANGLVTAEGLTAGKWSGVFNFTIVLERDSIITFHSNSFDNSQKGVFADGRTTNDMLVTFGETYDFAIQAPTSHAGPFIGWTDKDGVEITNKYSDGAPLDVYAKYGEAEELCLDEIIPLDPVEEAKEAAVEYFAANVYDYCYIDSERVASGLKAAGQNNGDYGPVSELYGWHQQLAQKYPDDSIGIDIYKVTHSPKGIAGFTAYYSDGTVHVYPSSMRWADRTMTTTVYYDVYHYFPKLKSFDECPVELKISHVDGDDEILEYDSLNEMYEKTYQELTGEKIELNRYLKKSEYENIKIDLFNKELEEAWNECMEHPEDYVNVIKKTYQVGNQLKRYYSGSEGDWTGRPWGDNFLSCSANVPLDKIIDPVDVPKMNNKTMAVTVTTFGGTNAQECTFDHNYNENTGYINLGIHYISGKCAITLHTFVAEPK